MAESTREAIYRAARLLHDDGHDVETATSLLASIATLDGRDLGPRMARGTWPARKELRFVVMGADGVVVRVREYLLAFGIEDGRLVLRHSAHCTWDFEHEETSLVRIDRTQVVLVTNPPKKAAVAGAAVPSWRFLFTVIERRGEDGGAVVTRVPCIRSYSVSAPIRVGTDFESGFGGGTLFSFDGTQVYIRTPTTDTCCSFKVVPYEEGTIRVISFRNGAAALLGGDCTVVLVDAQRHPCIGGSPCRTRYTRNVKWIRRVWYSYVRRMPYTGDEAPEAIVHAFTCITDYNERVLLALRADGVWCTAAAPAEALDMNLDYSLELDPASNEARLRPTHRVRDCIEHNSVRCT